MKRIFSIFVATLLLSTTLLAQNVATLGSQGYTKANFAQAISDWATNGGELTLNEDCEYNATATVTISKNATLNLAGNTLTWNSSSTSNVLLASADLTILGNGGAWSFVISGRNSTFGAIQSTAALKILNANITVNKTVADKGMRAIYTKGGSLDMQRCTINIKNNCYAGLYLDAKTEVINLKENSINYTYDLKSSSLAKAGIIAGIDTKVSFTSVDNKINMHSSSPANEYGIYLENTSVSVTVKGNNSVCNAHSPIGNYRNNTTNKCEILDGTFIGTNAAFATSISGGKFNKKPAESALAKGYIYKQVGGDGEDKDYYTVAVDEGQVVALVNEEYYFSEEDLWKAVDDDWYTITLYTTNPITVPAGRTVILEAHDATKEYNIINNGIVYLQSTFLANFTTKGEIHVEGNGVYPETYYNNYVKGNVVDGNQIYYDADAKKYHVVNSRVVVICGETPFTKISYAFRDVKDGESIVLLQDVSLSRSYYTVNGGKHITLNLNGHTLSGVYSKAALHIQNASLAVKNGAIKTSKLDAVAEGNSYCFFYLYGDTLNANAKDFSVLTIAEDVTMETPGTAIGVMYRQKDTKLYPQSYGVRVDIDGTIKGEAAISVSGVLTNTKGNVPVINISDKAKMNVTEGAVYAAGYAKWTYAGTINTDNFGVEVRAGEFTMDGGSIVSTATKPADDQFNGNGSTSQACGIAVCQHSTKLPINVVVNDGYIKAYTPLYQSNPQNNETDMKQINLTVNGGKFFSTSKNIVYSLNKRIFLNGGVYNMNPSAYAAEGKVVVANTDEATKDMYPYTIGDVKTGVIFQTAGEWSNAANWSATATAETPVTIAANVTIGENVKAEAYGITVAEGKTITIQKGGMLVVGKQGVAGITSADQLIIEDGGYLLISPAATTNNQPLATVKKVLNIGNKASYEEDESPYMRRHIGIPTQTQPTIIKNIAMGAREWDVMNGWQDATDILAKPFKGYSVTTDKQDVADVDIAFLGTLIGNEDVELAMYREGFFLFANSWVAPIDAKELLNQLKKLKNDNKVEANITVFVPEDIKIGKEVINSGRFFPITENTLKNSADYAQYWGTIAPLTGFFLHANTNTAVSLNYEKAVWNAQLAVKTAAPKRVAEENNAVRITLTAADGRQDNVYLYDGEEYHITKMMNDVPNVNIYVETAQGNYTEFASKDLDGTVVAIQTNSQTNYSLSFDWLRGETLYIKDLQTNVVTPMTEGNVYNFTATAKETSRRFAINSNNAPTAMDEVMANTAAKGVYSITGQYLGDRSVLETLPQGIYVVDGKKYIQ